MILLPGVTASIWGPSVAMLADAMGVTLDGIDEAHHVIHADEDFEIASGRIAKGTVSGMSFEIRGMVDGVPRIVIEHITKLRREDFPEHGLDDCGRVVIEGEPNIKVDMLASPRTSATPPMPATSSRSRRSPTPFPRSAPRLPGCLPT